MVAIAPDAPHSDRTMRFALYISLTVLALAPSTGCSLGGDVGTYVPPDQSRGPQPPDGLRARAGADQVATPGELVVLDGRASTTRGGGQPTFEWRQLSGDEVDFVATIATPTFEAPIGRQELLFELTVTEGGESDGDTIVVQIANSAPAAHAGDDQGVEAGPVVLDARGSTDPDGDELSFQWTQSAGPEVDLQDPASATARFDAPAMRADYTFTVRVADPAGDAATDEVIVSVGNHAPVAQAGADQIVQGGSEVSLDGSASSDHDGDVLWYIWTQTAGEPVALDDDRASTPSFRAPLARQAVTFELVVSDGSISSPADAVTVQVANNAPTVSADAPATVGPGEWVVVDASGSADPDGDEIEFLWTLTEGEGVTLTSEGERATFLAPQVRSRVVVRLEVRDALGGSAQMDSTISVGNALPTVDAGPDRTAHVGTPVIVEATGQDPDGDELEWTWSQIEGPSVSFEVDGPTLAFTAPTSPAELMFKVSVSDGVVTAQDTVRVSIDNAAPTADAGERVLTDTSATTTLDGSRSTDPDGDTLFYNWTQIQGAPVDLEGADTATPQFDAPAVGQSLQFELIVNDGLAWSPPDTVVVVVRNDPPVASAGAAQTIDGGAAFTLTGGASFDPDGDPLRYAWAQVQGDAATVVATDGPSIALTAPMPRQQLVFELTVDDGLLGFDTDVVTVDIRNNAPMANAGPTHEVAPGTLVILDGSASVDVDGDPLTYTWRQLSGTEVDAGSWEAGTLQFEAPGFRTTSLFGLTVSDGQRTSLEALVQVNVSNSAPIAHAGPDQLSAVGGSEVTLDARGSSDQDDDELTYLWEQIDGNPVSLDDWAKREPKFHTGRRRQAYVFRLTVRDGFVAGEPDTVTIATRNNAPVADAGPDRDISPGRVSVVGSGMDIDDDDLEYSWTQHSGPTVRLDDADTATVRFIAPDSDDQFELDLTVRDPFGAEHTDRIRLQLD